jgi:hypothetical protein
LCTPAEREASGEHPDIVEAHRRTATGGIARQEIEDGVPKYLQMHFNYVKQRVAGGDLVERVDISEVMIIIPPCHVLSRKTCIDLGLTREG